VAAPDGRGVPGPARESARRRRREAPVELIERLKPGGVDRRARTDRAGAPRRCARARRLSTARSRLIRGNVPSGRAGVRTCRRRTGQTARTSPP
jgi:hypothetical protein